LGILILLLLIAVVWVAASVWARASADQFLQSPEGKAVVQKSVETIVAARQSNATNAPAAPRGIWDAVKRAASHARDQTSWTILRDTIAKLGELPDDVRANAILGFIDKREKLQSRLPNMTAEGRLKMGAFLQQEARKRFDLDMAEGYALWMAGAWLESSQRDSVHASLTHGLLETIARECSSAIDAEDGTSRSGV